MSPLHRLAFQSSEIDASVQIRIQPRVAIPNCWLQSMFDMTVGEINSYLPRWNCPQIATVDAQLGQLTITHTVASPTSELMQ